ncbi:cytochrome c3 family protein [Oceanithermus sp.]|uniref:cytochrome c3 family protein n=1 Tax=Oceanithermus sp. TaxID=2268145 RepID=UPI0025FD55A7|nr:cytochrome c3 family protein [Oceanithermus sp.]
MKLRHLGWIALALAVGWVLAEGGRYLWVTVDPETQELGLSDGTPLPASLAGRVVPGQYVEVENGRYKIQKVWRPPLDLEKTFTPEGASRVVFSHERHFAALGAKGAACETCHATLDEAVNWPSLAPDPALEPHGETSQGRFCSSCHDGVQTTLDVTAEIEGARPPVDATLFTAFGREGDESCSSCHAPKDHGADYVPWHGERAEDGRAAANCTSCHRGADRITNAEMAQAQAFYHDQMTLLRDPEDERAFNTTLPNNFCAYCHGLDLKAWRGD